MNDRAVQLVGGLFLYALSGSAANAVLIDFDDGPSSGSVGSFYSSLGVTFGNANFSNFGNLPGGSPERTIIAQIGGTTPTPSAPLVATFDFDVISVTIRGLDVGANGIRIDAYDAVSGGNLLDFDTAFGSDLGVGEFYDITAASAGIRRVEFYQPQAIVADGLAWDNFVFETASVPEPSTVALMAFGLAGLGFARRKKA